jgi:hypothetical protein
MAVPDQTAPHIPMQTTAVRPPLALPQAGVAAAPQPSTAIAPPLTAMRTSPSVALAYGAQGADARPY